MLEALRRPAPTSVDTLQTMLDIMLSIIFESSSLQDDIWKNVHSNYQPASKSQEEETWNAQVAQYSFAKGLYSDHMESKRGRACGVKERLVLHV